MTERFKKAYDALYDAFMNDRLQSGNCSACAVGSIIGSAQGANWKLLNILDLKLFTTDTNNNEWKKMFSTMNGHQYFDFNQELNDKLIATTGYDAYELSMIEYEFETNTKIKFYHDCNDKHKLMEDQMNGLCAVIDLMIDLDKINDGKNYKEQLKNKFISQ
jgi:hypothetical protein